MMQTAVVLSFLPLIKSGQKHLARHSESHGKQTRKTEEEVGKQHQGMDRPRVQQVPEGSGEQVKMEKRGCKIICGATTTLAVKGLMMMMMFCTSLARSYPLHALVQKGVSVRLASSQAEQRRAANSLLLLNLPACLCSQTAGDVPE